MKKALSVFTNWRCTNLCEYCVLPDAKKQEDVNLDLDKLIKFLSVNEISSFDVSGGEPLRYERLVEMSKKVNIPWAITTSLKPLPLLRKFLNNIGMCSHITCSYHPHLWESPEEYLSAVAEVKKVVHASTSAVTPYVKPLSDDMGLNPFDEPRKLLQQYVLCNAGINYAVIAPDGTVYRCWGTLQLDTGKMGNMDSMRWLIKPATCNVSCPNCYSVSGQYGIVRSA